MNRTVDVIAVKTKKGEFAGWTELYNGLLVKDQKTGADYVYAVERCNPLNRYYKIALSDLSVGVTNDTLYINIEQDKWGDTSKGDKKFNDNRIECFEGTKGLPNDEGILQLLALAATNKMAK